MKLSIESGCFPNFSHKERLDVIKNAGFDKVDFSLFRLSGENAELLGENYIERAEELRAHLDGLGLSCSQAHAPFDMREGDPISLDCEKYLRLTRAIEVAAILGAPSIVVHAILIKDRDHFEEYNREFYISLLPYAERVGIRIAVAVMGNFVENTLAQFLVAFPVCHNSVVKLAGGAELLVKAHVFDGGKGVCEGGKTRSGTAVGVVLCAALNEIAAGFHAAGNGDGKRGLGSVVR